MIVINFPFNSKEFTTLENKNNTIVLGGFDSMHLGHYQLFAKALEIDKDAIVGLIKNVEDLPSNINKSLIFNIQSRLEILNSIQIKKVILFEFDNNFKNLEPNEFIDKLVNLYNIKNIIVGEDYHLGKNAKWNALNLKAYFKNTYIIPIKKNHNFKISTSLVREIITTGEINTLNTILIRPFNFYINLFSSLEFDYPLNITKLHPGIYCAYFYIEDFIYHGLVLIGFDNINKIYFFNFNFEKPINNIKILFINELRLIISKDKNKILEVDKKNAKNIFLNYDTILKNSDLIW